MAGYTRQSVADILNGSEITAPPINAEFNQLVAAFNGSTGHSHDGSTGNAPKIDLTTSISGYLPAAHGGIGGRNKFDATSAPATSNDNSEGYAPGSMWENVTDGRVYICVGNSSNAAVWRELVTVFSGPKIEPVTHNSIDIGTNTVRFKDLYLQGGSTIQGNSTFAGTLGVSGLSTLDSLTVTNATTLNGAVTIGNSSADLVGFNGRLTTGLVPNTDDNVDLGTSTLEWRNLYLDGTAHIDTLDVDENAGIDGNLSVGGTLGVTGTTTYSTATGSNLTATGTINFANATVSNLGTVTTAAIGGGSLNNVVIGGSTPAAITGTTITGTSLVGPLTGNVTGNVTGNLTGNVTGNVTGNLTGNVTATSGTSNFTNVTISGQLNMDATSAATITNLSAPVSDNDAARKIDVDNAVANLVDSAPGTLDTLNELAAALGDDPDFATTITNSIATKLPKAGGTMSGAINMGGQKITNAADPTAAQDLATKNYIDTTYVDYSSAGDAATDARKLATNAEDVQFTLADGSTTGYSALHYAAKAAASYDSFDDRYLGSKASDPTLDNDNNALITGALYFDSTNGVMKVYNGTEWANASSSIEGIKSNFYYTATSGQTAFSGSDDNSNTLVIDKAGLVNVYMNGVRLHEDDYTVSAAGDSVTLAAGAATGDLIYLEVFGNFAGQSGADVAITGGSITGLTELGIGVDNPLYPLHIQDAANQLATFESTDANANIGFKDSATTSVAQVGVKTNDLFFATGGSESARLDSLGNFGIGTTSPSGNLEVKGSVNSFVYVTAANTASSRINFGDTDDNDIGRINYNHPYNYMDFYVNGSEKMRILSNGNMGIGTTGPTAKLHVAESGNTEAQIRVQSGGGDFRRTEIISGSSAPATDAVLGSLRFYNGQSTLSGDLVSKIDVTRGSNNNLTNMLFFTSGTERLRIKTNGHLQFSNSTDNVITSNSDSSRLRLFGGGTNSVGNGAALTLQGVTASGGNYADLASADGGSVRFRIGTQEKMRILNTGSVGIGTDSPSGTLHVKGDTNSNGGELYLQVNNNNTTDTIGAISFGNNVDTSLSRILAGTSGTNSTSYLTFSTSSAGTMAEAMRLSSDGNLGIGTTSPNTGKLVVAGSENYSLSGSGQARNAGIHVDGGTAGGNGTYGGAISFGTGSGSAAISSIQTGSDGDTQGLAFHTHPSGTGSANSVEQMRLLGDGTLQLGVTSGAGQLLVKNTGTGDGNEIAAFQGTDVSQRLLVHNFLCGSDEDRVGLMWENQGTINVRMWMGDDGKLYSKNSLPTADNDGNYFVQVNSSGNIVMPNGKGIDFSATANGSGTTSSEVLDDYEEGTWTPTSGIGTAVITGTATYVKIGKMVFIAADVQMPNQTNTNQARITGLPFTPYQRGSNSEYDLSAGEHTYGSYITLSLHSSYPAIVFRPNAGTSVDYSNVSAKRFRFSGWYEVA